MFRKLRAEEIDVRIASVKPSGISLLLYKDARCDMNILDETVGPLNWQREHTRENANCIVSIWDKDKEQWISKEDTGAESFTEKEKGLASDSFKRACFNWGLGRELYTAPFIWINASDCNIQNSKCYDKFEVSEIGYKDGTIASLTIINSKTKKRVYSYGLLQSANINKNTKAPKNDLKDDLTELEKATLESLIKKKGMDINKLYPHGLGMSKETYVATINKLMAMTDKD